VVVYAQEASPQREDPVRIENSVMVAGPATTSLPGFGSVGGHLLR
jgi:hypothetical protein